MSPMYPPNVLPDCQRYYRWWWRQSEELWAVHAMDDYPEMEELTSGLDYKFLSCECVTIDYRKSLHGTYGITRPLETGEEFLIAVSFHGEPHESEFNAIGEHAVSHRAHCERWTAGLNEEYPDDDYRIVQLQMGWIREDVLAMLPRMPIWYPLPEPSWGPDPSQRPAPYRPESPRKRS